MKRQSTIHYNEHMSLLRLRSEGEGTCGKSGPISGYHGMVTCEECQEVISVEVATTNQERRSHVEILP